MKQSITCSHTPPSNLDSWKVAMGFFIIDWKQWESKSLKATLFTVLGGPLLMAWDKAMHFCQIQTKRHSPHRILPI